MLIASARHRTIFAVLAMDGIFTVSSFMCEEASVDLYDDYLYGSMLGNEVAEMMGMVHQKKECNKLVEKKVDSLVFLCAKVFYMTI